MPGSTIYKKVVLQSKSLSEDAVLHVFCRTMVASLVIFQWTDEKALAQTPSCVTNAAAEMESGSFSPDVPICSAESDPWEIQLQDRIGRIGFLTDGTALGIAHLPQRSDVPTQDWPLPVVLTSISNHVWSIGELYKDEVVLSNDPMRFFLWTPGNSRSGHGVDGVDWGDNEARLFRCISDGTGENCVTYYPLRNCPGDQTARREMTLSVSIEGASSVVETLDTFGVTDQLAREILESLWAASCGIHNK